MDKKKLSFDFWEDMPRDMKKYLKNYGYHFNHKLYKFAVENMYKVGRNGSKEKIEPIEKDKIDELSKKHNITIENNVMYDAAYVYSMALADFFGKSLPNEQYVAMWVKDKIDEYKIALNDLTYTEVSGTSSPRGRILDRNYNVIVDNKSLKTIVYK